MAGLPSKKRRVVIELSSSSEAESSPPPDPSAARSRASARSSIKAASILVSNNVSNPVSRAVSATSEPKPKPPTSKPVPKKVTGGGGAAPQPKKNSTKSKSTHSFFSLANRPSSSTSTAASRSATIPLSSQHEDADDLIEDFSSDEDWRRMRLGSRSSQGNFNKLSPKNQRSQGAVKNTNGNSSSRPQSTEPSNFSTPNSSSSAKLRKVVDSLPWAERFAPKTSSELAVHVRKIAEVRTWLENVFNRRTGKRLLVLKGSAGTGKTATIEILSKELRFEILEWRNPSTSSTNDTYGTYGGEGDAFPSGFTGVFEEFLSRAGKFGTLELGPAPSAKPTPSCKKIILIEDFPNALFTSSRVPLMSFRRAIKSFLAMPSLPRPSAPLPPLVLIISETAAVMGSDSFTAYRLLSSEILNHPLTTAISFNKIAPTFMVKALNAIIAQESLDSGRKLGPSKAVLEALSSSGDVRSAIMGLEFLAVNGEQAGFLEKFAPQVKGKRKKAVGEECLREVEKEMLKTVTQRESNLGLFHAVGKVVYNKRYGDDPQDPYVPPPPRPPLPHQPYRNRTSRADPGTLMDEAGTDIQTLVSGIHENYLPSCNLLGGLSRNPEACMEDIIECVNICLDALSDSDMLAPSRTNMNMGKLGGRISSPSNVPIWGPGFGNDNEGAANIRMDEISLQVAVRGTVMGLPTPVKREPRDNKMFYPMGLRLWREQEEMEGAVESLLDVASRQEDSKGKDELIGIARGMTQPEMVLERMPYIKVILKARQIKGQRRWPKPPERGGNSFVKNLEKVTTFRGVGFQSDEVPDEDDQDGKQIDELEAAEEQKGKGDNMFRKNSKPMQVMNNGGMFLGEGVEKLVLSDDDIED